MVTIARTHILPNYHPLLAMGALKTTFFFLPDFTGDITITAAILPIVALLTLMSAFHTLLQIEKPATTAGLLSNWIDAHERCYFKTYLNKVLASLNLPRCRGHDYCRVVTLIRICIHEGYFSLNASVLQVVHNPTLQYYLC